MKTINMSKPVLVCGTMPGFVQYTTADGYIGVTIVGEHGRIDEWHPTQVKEITLKEAAEWTIKMLGK